MVVLLDLEQDGLEHRKPHHAGHDPRHYLLTGGYESEEDERNAGQEDRANPNVNSFSEAMGCYPIVSLLARKLDLNSLHDLSRTCRQVRVNLLQYHRQLMSQALRCENEDPRDLPEQQQQRPAAGDPRDMMHRDWTTYGPNGVRVSKITSGKVGACARDMVGHCRRCDKVVCRNCIVKAPLPMALQGRHRRLCRTCVKSPLDEHTRHVVDECNPADDSSNSCCCSSSPSSSDEDDGDNNHHAAHNVVALARDPCSCQDQVWICQPCGQSLRTADTTYMRGWTWRTRYSTHLGGLGTGIGEGVEGVQCGRNRHCLAAKEVETEIDCDAHELEALRRLDRRAHLEGRTWGGTSYLMQEMDGVGGVVKKKVKRRVRVGAVVKEYEDERDDGKFLSREQGGQNRTWCSWCDRVVRSKADLLGPLSDPEGGGLRRTVSRSSSSASSI